MIPLTIPEIKRLLAGLTTQPLPRWHVIHWDAWTRRHQARSRWFHQNAPDSPATSRLPWSASEMRLPYWCRSEVFAGRLRALLVVAVAALSCCTPQCIDA